MRRISPLIAAFAFSLGTAHTVAAEPPSAETIVDAFEGAVGKHAGKRRSGAKGFCAAGEFVATGAGARFSTAANLAPGARSPVVARFSNGGGNPRSSDTANGLRGLALAIDVPGGDDHHFVIISAPVFGFRTVEALVDRLQSLAPDPATGRPDPGKVSETAAKYPEMKFQADWVRDTPPSASMATAPFYGVNTFMFTNASGTKQPARWTFEPMAGRVGLTAEQRQSLSPDFLHAEMVARVGQAVAEWRVLLQLPQPGDPLLDATAAWPADREAVHVATLRITGVTPVGQVGDCEATMFDPMRLPAGIDASDDPILLNRSAPYAVSLTRRTQ